MNSRGIPRLQALFVSSGACRKLSKTSNRGYTGYDGTRRNRARYVRYVVLLGAPCLFIVVVVDLATALVAIDTRARESHKYKTGQGNGDDNTRR